MEKKDQIILILKCKSSFYTENSHGSLDKKIPCASLWLDLGVENGKRKLKRLDRKMQNPYAYVDKSKVVRNFEIKGEWKDE